MASISVVQNDKQASEIGFRPDKIHSRIANGPRPFHHPLPTGRPVNQDHQERDTVPKEPLSKDYALLWRSKEEGSESIEDLQNYRPKIVAIWMRKGGVGKSNSVYMLGHALADKGVETMMVDCDSQQDLTELCFRAEVDAYDDDEYDDVETFLREKKLPRDRSVADLASALYYTLNEKEPRKTSKPPQATECNLLQPYPFPVGQYRVKRDMDEEGSDAHDADVGKIRQAPKGYSPGTKKLYLVLGGSKFEDMENKLNNGIGNLHSSKEPKFNCPGAMFHAIWNAGKSCNAKVILLDLSPALGVTNQLLICHSDYFICPCEVEQMSIKNLGTIYSQLRTWYKDFQFQGPKSNSIGFREVSRGYNTGGGASVEAELPLPEIQPKFLGIIINKYIADRNSVRQPLGTPYDKRSHAGHSDSVPLKCSIEGLKSKRRTQAAAKLLETAADLARRLSRPRPGSADHIYDPEDNGFSVHEEIFIRQGPGLGEYRHGPAPAGSPQYIPMHTLLGRVRAATPLFQFAPNFYGKPINVLKDSDLEILGLDQKTANREDLAHFARVFGDMASFISKSLPPFPLPDSRQGDRGSRGCRVDSGGRGHGPRFNFVLDPTDDRSYEDYGDNCTARKWIYDRVNRWARDRVYFDPPECENSAVAGPNSECSLTRIAGAGFSPGDGGAGGGIVDGAAGGGIVRGNGGGRGAGSGGGVGGRGHAVGGYRGTGGIRSDGGFRGGGTGRDLDLEDGENGSGGLGAGGGGRGADSGDPVADDKVGGEGRWALGNGGGAGGGGHGVKGAQWSAAEGKRRKTSTSESSGVDMVIMSEFWCFFYNCRCPSI
jgi:cellulose biosynthesis protein BcsQ